MVDLTTRIGSLQLKNPIMPGSGTFAEGLDDVVDLDRLGAFVTKSATPGLRSGNPIPRIAETPAGMLNSIGLPSKGVDDFLARIVPFYARFAPPLIASVSADTIAQFETMAAAVSVPGVAAIEANISCPNIEEDGRAFAMHADVTERVIRRMVAATDRPVWAKLTPTGRSGPSSHPIPAISPRSPAPPRRRAPRRSSSPTPSSASPSTPRPDARCWAA